jgi:hypothetical protein
MQVVIITTGKFVNSEISADQSQHLGADHVFRHGCRILLLLALLHRRRHCTQLLADQPLRRGGYQHLQDHSNGNEKKRLWSDVSCVG